MRWWLIAAMALGAVNAAAASYYGSLPAFECPEDQICIHIEDDDPEALTGEFLQDGPAVLAPPNGFVDVVAGDVRILARRFTIDQETRAGVAEGRVEVRRPEMILLADRLDFDLDGDVYVFDGEVYLEERGGEELTRLWADHVEFDGATEDFSARGNVRFEAEDMAASGDALIYDRSSGRIEMTGSPATARMSDGTLFSFSRILVWDADGERRLEGYGRANITIPRDSDANGPADG